MGVYGRPSNTVFKYENMRKVERREYFELVRETTRCPSGRKIARHTISGLPCKKYYGTEQREDKYQSPSKTKRTGSKRKRVTSESSSGDLGSSPKSARRKYRKIDDAVREPISGLTKATKFRKEVTWRIQELIDDVYDLPSLIDTLIRCWKVVGAFHRQVSKSRVEKYQEGFIPDTREIALLWKVFLQLQERCKDFRLPMEVEFAPFVVYGRSIEDRTKDYKGRWSIRDEFEFLPLRTIPSFVRWASARKKRVVALYLNLARVHIMAMMFKPAAAKPDRFVGLHKFDSNASMKSRADNNMRADEFPEIKFYRNTTRLQSIHDFTCTFWCMHWILWKMTVAARITYASQTLRERGHPEDAKGLITRSRQYLDSFRSDAYKKFARSIRDYMCSPLAVSTKELRTAGLLLLSDPSWLDADC